MELLKHHAHMGLPRLTRSGVSSDKGMFLRPQGRLMQLGQEHWLSPVVLELECGIRISQEAWVSQWLGPTPAFPMHKCPSNAPPVGVGAALRATGLTQRKYLLGV